VHTNELISKILLEFSELEKHVNLMISSIGEKEDSLDLLKLYFDEIQDSSSKLASYLCVLYDFYKDKTVDGVGYGSVICSLVSLLISRFIFSQCLIYNKSNLSRLVILNKLSTQETTKANLEQLIELLGKNGEGV